MWGICRLVREISEGASSNQGAAITVLHMAHEVAGAVVVTNLGDPDRRVPTMSHVSNFRSGRKSVNSLFAYEGIYHLTIIFYHRRWEEVGVDC